MTTENKSLALQSVIVREAVKESVLEMLENSVDERGLPVYGVIEIEDADGNPVQAYKQESLFTADDYQKAAAYQAKLANDHRELADYYLDKFRNFPKF